MSATLHRKDMTAADFHLLGSFSDLYNQTDPMVSGRDFGLICLLDNQSMYLPGWYQEHKVCRIANIKEYKRDAVGIETVAFRRMCKVLGIKEEVVVNTLFRFSMLSVVSGQNYYEKPRFRMPFHGEIKGLGGAVEPSDGFGFVIERRRLEGAFRKAVLTG